MKKLILGLTFAAFAAIGSVMAPGAAYALDDKETRQPIGDNSQLVPLTVAGVAVSSRTTGGDDTTALDNQANASTSAQLWASGAGTLYDLVVGTAATTTACWCSDESSATDINSYDGGTPNLIAIVVAATASIGHAGIHSAIGHEFRKGLSCECSTDVPYFPVFRKGRGGE